MEHLNFEDREERKAFIENTPSGLYIGTDTSGRKVVVMVDRFDGMTVKYLNSKGWYECIDYDCHGFRESDYLEKGI